jgi:hypothetical protein
MCIVSGVKMMYIFFALPGIVFTVKLKDFSYLLVLVCVFLGVAKVA